MIAPKGPGHTVRSNTSAARRACLIAIHKDPRAMPTISPQLCLRDRGGRAGIIETSFKEECETDLFGEQVVLCAAWSS